jgi:hypothetical protein
VKQLSIGASTTLNFVGNSNTIGPVVQNLTFYTGDLASTSTSTHSSSVPPPPVYSNNEALALATITSAQPANYSGSHSPSTAFSSISDYWDPANVGYLIVTGGYYGFELVLTFPQSVTYTGFEFSTPGDTTHDASSVTITPGIASGFVDATQGSSAIQTITLLNDGQAGHLQLTTATSATIMWVMTGGGAEPHISNLAFLNEYGIAVPVTSGQ